MKYFLFFFLVAIVGASCGTARVASAGGGGEAADTSIVQSLFADRNSSISEDNIQRLLDGNYRLPGMLRVAVVRLESAAQRRYGWYDESVRRARQSYLDSLTARLRSSARVESVTPIPAILLATPATFTNIREAAVRLQCNMVLIYSVNSDYYAKYKAFNSPDWKAYATTEGVLMDVRTGMIPFSTTVTKDVFSTKTKTDLTSEQARDRVLDEAALATINDIGGKIVSFLR